jgi:ABC-type multidrug transport system ATPase subunit
VRTLLRVEQLSKRFGSVEALTGIGFEVREGEILGLIGPNGSGKTTLLECLVDLLPPSRGSITPGVGRKELMFYLPDGIRPYSELVTGEVLVFFSELYAVERERWAQLLRQLDLVPVVRKRVGALSKGNRQRLLLALGLLAPQPLLLLDEPFDGLDAHQTRSAMALLQAERAAGRTLLLAIHQLVDAEQICDRFVLLSGGRLAAVGSLAELRAQAGLPLGNLQEVFLALT